MPNVPRDEPNLEEILASNEELVAEIERLRRENEELLNQYSRVSEAMRRAKNPDSVVRPSLKRLLGFVLDACMQLRRVVGGWELSLGQTKKRIFKRLKDIWEIFVQENWYLSDIFPPDSAPVARGDRPLVAPRLRLRYSTIAPAAPRVTGGDVTFADGFP